MKTDWQVILNSDHTFGSDCHLTCGGFCCSYKDISKHLKIFTNLQTLQMSLDEYSYTKEQGHLQPDFVYTPVQYKISEDLQFTTIVAKCSYEGLCPAHQYRPFLCKLFPFYPVVDDRGNIDGFIKGKVWQEFLYDKTPCTVTVDKDSNVPGMQRMVTEMFKEPKNIFYFKAMDILTDALKERFEALKAENFGLPFPELLRKVEFLYLKNDLLDTDQIRLSIHQLFKRMKRIWGNDLVLDVFTHIP